MNRLQIGGRWNELKGKVKQKWANLTDDDLKYEEGKDDELVGRIEKKTGDTAENIRNFFRGLTKG
ncbi:MAG: CsbD family protein [Ignavibacteriae bacterium]|nr:MAG: CsbD family protein [Ignavibacteriota bacterium]